MKRLFANWVVTMLVLAFWGSVVTLLFGGVEAMIAISVQGWREVKIFQFLGCVSLAVAQLVFWVCSEPSRDLIRLRDRIEEGL